MKVPEIILEWSDKLGPSTKSLVRLIEEENFTQALTFVNHYMHPSEDDANYTIIEFYSLIKLVCLEELEFIAEYKEFLEETILKHAGPNHDFLGMRTKVSDYIIGKAEEYDIDYFQVCRFAKPQKLKISIYSPWWAWADDVTSSTFDTTFFAGSEYMTLMMGDSLSKLGHDVTVWSKVSNEFMRPSGAKWKNFEEYPFDDTSIDILVVSRDFPSLLKDKRPGAKKIYTWHHDFGMVEIEPIPQENYDRMMCLSVPHANFYSNEDWCDRTKIFTTRNGIETDLFYDRNINKDPYKIIFGSEADRGLKPAIEVFKLIKKEFPNASLHAYYSNMHKYLEKGEADYKDKKIDRGLAALQLAEETEGVFIHGGVPHKQFVNEMKTSGLWIYWQDFWETSCIVAMEAQAAQVPVITTTGSALAETVSKQAGVVYDQRVEDQRFDPHKIAEDAIKILRVPELQKEYGELGYIYALQNYDIMNVAREWAEDFYEVLNANHKTNW